jgi:anaerobic selenocysteine-containing dehydrogenase
VALVIGDLFTEHPCTAKHVLPVKSASRDSEVIVVGPAESHTAWFANRHLRCKPGGEAAVLAGLLKAAVEANRAKLTPELDKFVGGTGWNELERYSGISKDDLEAAAGVLLGAAKVRTYLSNIFGRIGALDLASLFAEAMTRICPGESVFLPKFVQHNTWGIYSVLADAGGGKLLEKLESAELKALIILGLDIFSAYPAAPVEKALRGKKFTVTTQVFWNQTASRANVVIPAAVPVEKQGTVSIAFDEDLVRDEVVPPPGGAVTDADFLVAVAKEMGAELETGGTPDRKTARSSSCEWLSASWASYATEMGVIDAAETVLIPWSEPVHVGDGSLSRNFLWSEQTCPEPVLHISIGQAAAMKLKNGDTVTVTSEGSEVSLPVKITGRLMDGVVGATVHFPAVRKLFPWKLDEPSGEIRLAPLQVSMSRTNEKS